MRFTIFSRATRLALALLLLISLLASCGTADAPSPTAIVPSPTVAASPTPSPLATITTPTAAAMAAPLAMLGLPAPASDSSDILGLTPSPADERIQYGTDTQQFGDLRLPTGPGPYPIVIVLHGGYWLSDYDLTYSGFMAQALTEAGVATWNLEYRRLGNEGGGWPGTFADVAAGTDYLRTLAPTYNLDLTRVVALGHSAGGQLALWLAGRSHIAANSPLHSADPLALRGVVSLAGVADLAQGWDLRLGGGVVNELLGGSPAEQPDRYAATSPLLLLPLSIPQRLLHGDADSIVPFALSKDYVAAAQASGDDAQLIALPGAGHFQPVDPRTPEWLKVQENVLALLGP